MFWLFTRGVLSRQFFLEFSLTLSLINRKHAMTEYNSNQWTEHATVMKNALTKQSYQSGEIVQCKVALICLKKVKALYWHNIQWNSCLNRKSEAEIGIAIITTRQPFKWAIYCTCNFNINKTEHFLNLFSNIIEFDMVYHSIQMVLLC